MTPGQFLTKYEDDNGYSWGYGSNSHLHTLIEYYIKEFTAFYDESELTNDGRTAQEAFLEFKLKSNT